MTPIIGPALCRLCISCLGTLEHSRVKLACGRGSALRIMTTKGLRLLLDWRSFPRILLRKSDGIFKMLVIACLFQVALLQIKSKQFEPKCHTKNENTLVGTDWALANEEGMGSRLIWHGLARWHAYAVS